jgi:TonB family protein
VPLRFHASRFGPAGVVLLLAGLLWGCGGDAKPKADQATPGPEESLLRVSHPETASPDSARPATALPDSARPAVTFDTPPTPLDRVTPDCPGQSGSGSVRIQVTIDETGRVADAEVVESDLPAAFGKAAMEAARLWTWKPARDRNGVAMASTRTIPFSFLCD